MTLCCGLVYSLLRSLNCICNVLACCDGSLCLLYSCADLALLGLVGGCLFSETLTRLIADLILGILFTSILVSFKCTEEFYHDSFYSQ